MRLYFFSLCIAFAPFLWGCGVQPVGHLKRDIKLEEDRVLVNNTDPDDVLIKRTYEFTTAGHQKQIEQLRQWKQRVFDQIEQQDKKALQHRSQELATSIQSIQIKRLKNNKQMAYKDRVVQTLQATFKLDGAVFNELEFKNTVHKPDEFTTPTQTQRQDAKVYKLKLRCQNTLCHNVQGWLQQYDSHKPDKIYAAAVFYYNFSKPYIGVVRGLPRLDQRSRVFFDLEQQAAASSGLRADRVVWQVVEGVSATELQLQHPEKKDEVLNIHADVVNTREYASRAQIKTAPAYFKGLKIEAQLAGLNPKTGYMLFDFSVSLKQEFDPNKSTDKDAPELVSDAHFRGPPGPLPAGLLERVRFEVTDTKPRIRRPRRQATPPILTNGRPVPHDRDESSDRDRGRDRDRDRDKPSGDDRGSAPGRPDSSGTEDPHVHNKDAQNTRPPDEGHSDDGQGEVNDGQGEAKNEGQGRGEKTEDKEAVEPTTTTDPVDRDNPKRPPVGTDGNFINDAQLREELKHSIFTFRHLDPQTHPQSVQAFEDFEWYKDENDKYEDAIKQAINRLTHAKREETRNYLKNLPYIMPVLKYFYESEDVLPTMANLLYSESSCVKGGFMGAGCRARNDESSASGAFQFLNDTARNVSKKLFNDQLEVCNNPTSEGEWCQCSRAEPGTCDARYYVDSSATLSAVLLKDEATVLKTKFTNQDWNPSEFDYTLAMASYIFGSPDTGKLLSETKDLQARNQYFTPNLATLFRLGSLGQYHNSIAERIAMHFITTRPLDYFKPDKIRPDLANKEAIEKRIQNLFIPKNRVPIQKKCLRHGAIDKCSKADMRLYLLKYFNADDDGKPLRYSVPREELLRHLSNVKI